MDHIHAELRRIEARLAVGPDPFQHAGLHAAQQALAWLYSQKLSPLRLLLSWAVRQVQKIVRGKPVCRRCQILPPIRMLPDNDIYDLTADGHPKGMLPGLNKPNDIVDCVPPIWAAKPLDAPVEIGVVGCVAGDLIGRHERLLRFERLGTGTLAPCLQSIQTPDK